MTTRNVRPFVHLRVLSSYSLGLGLSTPADICRHARRIGFDSIALTDVSGTYGFVEFHRAAREVGVKPIYGVLVFLDWSHPPNPDDPPHWVTLLALDRAGLRNVCAAATVSSIRRERGEGVLLADLEGRADGVVAIAGITPRGEHPSPRHLLAPMLGVFHDRLFVESRGGLADDPATAQERVLADARALGVPPVLVQDVRFVGPAVPQRVDLLAGADEPAFEHRVFSDARAGSAGVDNGMRTAAEMSEWHDRDAEAYSNAEVIAALVQPDLLDAIEEDPAASEASSLLASPSARATLRSRVDAAFARAAADLDVADREALRVILDRELEALARNGLEAAFVRFEEVARAARDAGVVVGPASGLSFQSKCAFLLGLTLFDPYARVDGFHPGFAETVGDGCVLDLQVAPGDRPRLLAVLNRAFDDASVGYVPTVEHITAARALRMAAKQMNLSGSEFEDAAKVASRHHGATLRELAEENRNIGILYRQSAAFREVVSHAAAIEGLPFGFARTKRTLVVSPRPLRDFLGVTVSPETGERFVQSTRDSFPTGAIRRIDVTTLGALAILGDRGAPWSAGDTDAYRLIGADDLDGVYLLEGAPRRLAGAFGIESFDDLVLFIALLRNRGSGMSLGDRLVAFRSDPPAIPAAEKVAGVLTTSNGWLLFAEQIRGVVERLTGLSHDEAARLAHRFQEHSPGSLAALRREFLALTVEQSVSFEDATAWFGRLVRQSVHVLDRQRVIAEALITHRSLVFKAAQPLAFMARVLEHGVDDERRKRYREALEREGRWLPPDVRRSGRSYRVEGNAIREPLWMIDGVSHEIADRIIRMRAVSGSINSYEEFSCAAKEAGISFHTIDALVRAGAIEASVGRESGPEATPRDDGVAGALSLQLGMSLDDGSDSTPSARLYPPASQPPVKKEGNTRHVFRVIPTLLEFYPHPSASPVELAGRIRNLHEFRSSSGKTVGFFELFDSSGSVRVFVPWERVTQKGEPLSDGSRVVVLGKVRLRDGRKVCDALEIVVTEGGNGHGETSPDAPSKGDP